jgi:chemotaxis protein MotB
MITLLMVLFIVLFAISQVDQRRFDMLKDGMAAGFGDTPSPFQGQTSVMNADNTPMSQIEPSSLAPAPQKLDLQGAQSSQSSQSAQAAQAGSYAEAKAEVAKLEAVRRAIHKALAAHGFAHDVSMKIDERGLRVSLVSRHIVFEANMASLTSRGTQVLDVLAPVLRTLPNRLEIDGHTNQVKVKPKYFPTDWELSAARAVRVLRYLNEVTGLPNSRMEATAFGHTKPLVDPRKPGSQYVNKRVDIVIRTALPADARALLQKAAAAQDNQGGAS